MNKTIPQQIINLLKRSHVPRVEVAESTIKAAGR